MAAPCAAPRPLHQPIRRLGRVRLLEGLNVYAENPLRCSLREVVFANEIFYRDECARTSDGPETTRVLYALQIFTRVFTLVLKKSTWF